MTIIPDIAETMQTVLTIDAEQAAKESGFVQRQSKINGPVFVQSMMFGFLSNPESTVGELVQTAEKVGITVTGSGLVQRCTETGAEFLRMVVHKALDYVIAADPVAIPLLNRFTHVLVQDSSTIVLPLELADIWEGCGSSTEAGDAALKLQVQIDLITGKLTGIELQHGRDSDRASTLQTLEVLPKALYMTDLGYFKLSRFRDIAEGGAYWLSRMPANVVVFDADGNRWNEVTDLLNDIWDGSVVDIPVSLGVQERLEARLTAIRVPKDVEAQRRHKLKKDARKKGRTPTKRQLAMCAWTIFLTNAPVTLLTVEEIVVLARTRWQIELLFKLWKSEGQVDKSQSQKPYRILCEVYAKLLGMVVQHWLCLVELWAYPDRSLFKAVKTIRKEAYHLLSDLLRWDRLLETIADIGRVIAGCRIDQRKTAPNTYQLLLDTSLLGFQMSG